MYSSTTSSNIYRTVHCDIGSYRSRMTDRLALTPPSDRTATIRDRSATVQRPENVQGRRQTWTQREKKSKKITNLNKAALLLRSYCDLCDHTTFSRRSHHDLSALMAFLLRSMGDPAAFSPRSWGSYHASSTCIASARRPQGVSTTFSRRLYIKQIKFFGNFQRITV